MQLNKRTGHGSRGAVARRVSIIPSSPKGARGRSALPAAATAAAAVEAAVAARPAAAEAAAGARALLARLGLVDRQRAALELGAVQVGDRLVGALAHLDEAEAAGAAGLAVVDDLGPGDGAELTEGL